MGTTSHRLGVILGVASGIVFSLLITLPDGKTEEVLNFLGSLFAILWLVMTYLYQRKSMSSLGRAGFVVLLIGGINLILLYYLIFFAWKFDYATIEAQLNTPIIYLFWLPGPIYAWSIMALGMDSLRSGKLPRGSVFLWFFGWLLFITMPSHATIAVATAGMIWSGVTIWKGKDHETEKDVVHETLEEPQTADRQPSPGASGRLLPLDILRGLIMVLMAIDHTSLLIRKAHSFEIFDLPIPVYENSSDFLTRFITHICAPGFFFLMGAGMILFYASRQDRGWSNGQIARHFLSRGFLLIVLEQLLLDPVLYQRILWKEYGVLFGLGGALILGIFFLRLGTLPLLGIGAGLILITQIVPSTVADLGIDPSVLVRLLLLPGQTGDWFVLYPIIPWFGIAALGMAFGRELLKDRNQAYRKALVAGVILLVLFVLVRSFGKFGNFIPSADTGWIAFLNLVKYPPSLAFTSLTLGIDLLLIVLFARLSERLKSWGKPLLIFGGTALFFYFMHWFLLIQISSFSPNGSSLPVMYLVWALIVVLLFPICRTFLHFKQGTSPESFWRLF